MTKKSRLILQHILDCGVLEPSTTDEVLTIFSNDVASTVAVSIISNFSNNGANPKIETEFSIDWVMQVLAYALSLPTLYNETLNECLTIFRHWLTDETFFKDLKTRNSYARQIFRYLSQIFEYRNDNSHPAPRRELILILLNDFNRYQAELGSIFDDETWAVLVRILIGACDFLSQPESISVLAESSTKNLLLSKCFALLYTTLINSKLTTQEIWEVFYKFTKSWSSSEDFLTSWHVCLIDVWKKLLNLLFTPTLEYRTDVNIEELTLVGFQLQRFIDCIEFSSVTSTQELFGNFSRTVQDLVDCCSSHPRSSPALFQPLFPASVFFKLFSKWCFNCFDTDFTAGQTLIIKSLMSIAGDWDLYTSKDWSEILLATLLELIQRGNNQILMSILNNGYLLFRRFVSSEIFDMMMNAIEQFDPNQNLWLSFWASFSVLLMDEAETLKISPTISTTLLNKSTVQWATLNVHNILLRQSLPDFVTAIKKYTLNISDKKLTWRNEETTTSFDVISAICYMIASAPAYHNLKDSILEILTTFLQVVRTNISETRLRSAFLVLISQITKWYDAIFDPKISVDLLDFLAQLSDEQLIDPIQCQTISRLLCGRSLNRSFQSQMIKGISEYCTESAGDNQETLTLPPIATFKSGETALITVVGDTKRSDSFTIHVREPRGFFMWEIKDEFVDPNYSIDNTNYSDINSDKYLTSDKCQNSEISDDKDIVNLVDQMKENKCFDNNFLERNYYKDYNYVKSRKLTKEDRTDKLRHKAVDFLISTGLYTNVSRIEEDVSDIISKFDAIPTASTLFIPVIDADNDGIKLSTTETPLLQKFMQLIGTTHQFADRNSKPAVQFGLLTVVYDRNEAENADLCTIIFCESPLFLNTKHKSIPKSELLIVVRPVDERFYSCKTITKDTKFWCPILDERIVAAENLSETISTTIFMYAASHRKEILLEKDIARAELIKGVRSKPIDILSVAETLTLKCFA
ncbi:hypothetical protein TVAG_252180 [Trichomonas vaginalis G3]|uniref:Ral GTPase-activating protein subunit alpha/beta N-terminal domain-containing protein n=1 Tax=Trichomonas vaginalis (strain ATCC PRA-98 / G3) TaxID=412133 RepID=A2DVW0_TRIV3|nr:hypothetical protein TVAGG3_0846220 [Trichomonas vaginalis G3]EAY15405.1 hypothetical protein TVAG_252180 [Trichomonas vaginalis G3]KAI5499632.1 hypothetical protein TVAGG3_0846220 [Trichomonas vaginalis G3]|eukprot:XP_001327628.1 hypothetical protein [Trichomonas vaginalis G3]